ncbi:PREDICTED: archaemetzincin-1 isoform X1 [Galeopterus variegatus]|uniref:Archaemetzincin-1 isoform X1 n=1 Tax=Galeopterus variegatus TaxID=482537 RepID=A0ABM0Q9B3_GALVR|nr:PREDICTED: archaemetzincin-1 isoform X1 [Galeopterus variegatus]XP_008564953.1 PREDICTED: archaemetzincin-1 isoform X1 [Galeopterus variegatus]XP_008564954.1 PREDICTED: archaemetzincin-1 isoform X1 [Galeopterus variegatus]
MLQCRRAEEFSFGPRALKDALVSTNAALQQLYVSAFSPAERLFLSEAYNPKRTLFCTLLIHTAFDWLLSYPEAPEDFETFHASLQHRKQSLARKHIYLQPIDGILSFLKNNKPGDALCVLGLTLSDLYPHETWSFTFSKFLPGHEVGICSFARFSGEFLQSGPSAPDPALVEDAADGPKTFLQDRGRTLCFSTLGMVQCCKVTCHELCHLLGLGNCRWLRCLMQGTLSLDEALRRPLDLCPICLRKLQHVLGFKLIERYKRLYSWTQAVTGTWSGQDAREPSVSEDTLPFSADSGMCCESDSEPVTNLSEPLTPDACSHAFPSGLELEPEDGLSSLVASEALPQLGGPAEAIGEHERWLATCIQALEREVAEEEVVQVDRAVDALDRWEMFTGRLPATRQDLPCSRDSAGLRKVLGDKFSSLRKKLSTRKLSKAESSPYHWKGEEN